MKKQKKELMIILCLLLVLTAGYVGLKVYNPETEEAVTTYPITGELLADAEEITITNENGSFTFIKEDDIWYDKEDRTQEINSGQVSEAADAAAALTGVDKIENVEDMTQYGLVDPEITITLITEEGNMVLKIGDYNETVSKYYVCVEGETAVYTIESTQRTPFTEDFVIDT